MKKVILFCYQTGDTVTKWRYNRSMSDMTRLEDLEAQLAHVTELLEQTLGNTVVLYKRMGALAYMVECLAEQKQPSMTDAMRAEVDATLYPDEFADLAVKDPDEFCARYGDKVHARVMEHGVESICRFGELSAHQKLSKRKLQ